MSEIGQSRLPELYGGVLCLDFANTADSRGHAEIEENLFGYADLLRWSWHAGLADAGDIDRLRLRAAADPAAAAAALEVAIELRESIFRVFAGAARGTEAASGDLAVLQRAYASAMSTARLTPTGTGFGWQWDDLELDRPWWPVARSAIDLLTAGPLDRVKVCASTVGCAGLFLDTSKNRSRRWCSMQACGVELKVQRQNARRRSARTKPATS
jgi:predicted RNA-binding Zn ribbon-like protein